MVLNELDRSMDKVFSIAELMARLDTLTNIMNSYCREISDITQKIRDIYKESDTSDPSPS